jgi:hypothetical protein
MSKKNITEYKGDFKFDIKEGISTVIALGSMGSLKITFNIMVHFNGLAIIKSIQLQISKSIRGSGKVI